MTTAPPASPPFAVPSSWNLVAPGYAADNVDHFERYADDALRLAAVGPSDAVLDVATGPGSLAILASGRVARVDALDFSSAMHEALRARIDTLGVTNVQPREGDGQALPYPDASFDAAFSMFGLMFFPSRAKGFAELRRVLRPGGRAVVSSWKPMSGVPLLVAVFEALREALPDLPFGDRPGPLSDPRDLESEMGAAGFAVEIHDTTHAIQSPSMDAFFASMRRSLLPLVLLENEMGKDRFDPVADAMRRRLTDRFGPGPVDVPMPAWLALGRVA
jgi:SAM-dependent methyltransferase